MLEISTFEVNIGNINQGYYTGTMPDTIRVRLRWRDGRLDTWPDAVDATADVVQIFGPDGRYHGFVDSGEIDEEGFVILDEEPTGE